MGEGGMGRVYRARHQRMSRQFAIKVLFGDHATDPKMRDRFAREAEAASRLHHPNVISVTDFGETEEGLLFLVMDYVEGRELGDVIRDSGPLGTVRTRHLLRQLALGLVHAHDKGLVHRDFKAENVIVTGTEPDEVPRIVDFGIAVMREGGEARLTTEGMVLGTPAYMSPEQVTGVELDARTDLYSLGVLAYEMLAGVLPFEGPPLAVARMNLAAVPPRFNERVPGLEVDRGLEDLTFRLLEKRPEDRVQTAAEVIELLDVVATAASAAVVVPVRAEPTMPEDAPPARRRAAWPLWAVLALLLAGGVGILVATRSGEGSAASPRATVVPPDAGTPVAVAEPVTADAAPAVAIEMLGPADAGTTRGQPIVARKPDARRKPAPVAADASVAAPAPDPVATLKKRRISIDRRYVALGEAIEAIARAQGNAAAAPLWQSYRRIPLADAMIKESMVGQVEADLSRLERQVNALR
ncbi:MAG TPA: serine/threonine-protein kinase [Kofleriaceae bacterium]|nr:serine/threonine-protein kinase [Kofleriaceae bacterium]